MVAGGEQSMRRAAWSLVVALSWLAADEAVACGGPEQSCAVPLGTYHATAPAWQPGEPELPVLLHLHGSSRSGDDVLEDRELVEPALRRGYAVIAPDGMERPGRSGRSWSYGNRPPIRDEVAFLRQVLADAARRFHLDQERVLLSGFSAGGAMVWRVACTVPEAFAAYAPVAGGFGRNRPPSCVGPVRLLHTHGWRDDAVPLEGWPGRNDPSPDDIFAGMDLWRRVDRCPDEHASRFASDERFWRRAWSGCAYGAALELVLHPGGHEVPEGWTDLALDWFETVVPGPH